MRAETESTAGTQAQLLRYARDLKDTLRKERERTLELQRLSVALEEALAAERRTRLDLEWARHETILRLMLASRFKDEETGVHVARVTQYTTTLARYLDLPGETVRTLGAAAPMHDIGKIGIPDFILQKPGGLTIEERMRMESHTTIGAELLGESKSDLIQTACQIALCHHERWDGTGYPQGLKQREIPLPGRIVMLADIYDALRSPRCYKPAYTHEQASEIILRGDGRTRPEHFDPALLEAFRNLEREFELTYDSSLAVA